MATDAAIQALDTVEATFAPPDPSTLAPDDRLQIGRRFTWEALWLVEEGIYAGQWAWWVNADEYLMGWVPTEDLADVSAVSRAPSVAQP